MTKVTAIPIPVTLLFLLLGLSACSPGIPLARHTFSGQSDGDPVRFDPGWDDNFPGLAGFMMDYDDGDHESHTLMAGFFPENQGPSMIEVIYSDKKSDDSFHWAIDGIELPQGTTLHEERGIGHLLLSKVIMGPEFEGVPVLTGFGFFTRAHGDHNIDQISVNFWRNYYDQLELGLLYLDKDGVGDIEYEYVVTYALVPEDQVRTSGTLTGSDGGGLDSATFAANQPVLQGFELNYKKDDHELDQIGVRLAPGRADIAYNDKNNDDDFTWKIYWVDLSSR